MAPFIHWSAKDKKSRQGERYKHYFLNADCIREATYYDDDGPLTIVVATFREPGYQEFTIDKGDDAREAIDTLRRLK